MMNKFRKTASSIVKIICVAWFTYIIVIIIYPSTNLVEKKCHREKKAIYKGLITKIWSGNSGWFIDLNTRKTFLPRCQERIRDKIEVGDSLYKPKGTFDMYVYKKANPDSAIFIPCDFDCSFYEEKDE